MWHGLTLNQNSLLGLTLLYQKEKKKEARKKRANRKEWKRYNYNKKIKFWDNITI